MNILIENDDALKRAEQYVERQLEGHAVFPFDFYREDGSYIPIFESYRDPIIQAITSGIVTPTGDIIARLNMTSEEAKAAGLYYPQPCQPVGEVMNMIKHHHGTIEETQYNLSLQFLRYYGLRRYKGSFYIFKDNHYEYISDEALKTINSLDIHRTCRKERQLKLCGWNLCRIKIRLKHSRNRKYDM